MSRPSKTRQQRRQAERNQSETRSGLVVLLVVVGAVLAAAAVAAMLFSGGDDEADVAAQEELDQAVPVQVSGDPLPPMADGADASVGQPAPQLDGGTFAREPISVVPGNSPTVLMYLAHWCPHCQAEVPVVRDWINDGGLPDSVDLVSVATAISADQPNFPPQVWLAEEAWPAPVMVDPDDTAHAAYGSGGFPYYVFLNGDGTVHSRHSGELSIEDLEARVDEIAAT